MLAYTSPVMSLLLSQSFFFHLLHKDAVPFIFTRMINHFFEWTATVAWLRPQARAHSIVDILPLQVALIGDVVDGEARVQKDT